MLNLVHTYQLEANDMDVFSANCDITLVNYFSAVDAMSAAPSRTSLRRIKLASMLSIVSSPICIL